MGKDTLSGDSFLTKSLTEDLAACARELPLAPEDVLELTEALHLAITRVPHGTALADFRPS